MSLSERVDNNDDDVGPAFAAPTDSDENSHTSASSERMLQLLRLFVEGMGILGARPVREHPEPAAVTKYQFLNVASCLLSCIQSCVWYILYIYEFTWSFEPYVEFVPYSTRVLGSKGSAVGRGIGPLPNRPPDRRLPIVGRPPPGTRALNILSARGVCRGFGRFALCEEHRAHFWRPRNCNIC